jgi:hypothetical protein
MPSPAEATALSTEAPNLRAEARPRHQQVQRDRDDGDHRDQEQAIGAQSDAEHLHLAAQDVGQPHRLLRRARRSTSAPRPT